MSPTKSSRGVPKQIDKNALLVAQEITFAKILSGNDPKVRERGIKRLQKWLTARSNSNTPFHENDLNRIWKGLFYCMWMSDKPLVQEEVAENISKLIHCFKKTKACVVFVKCFFLTMAVEWRGLDQWRIDKFLMFVRRFIRQVFVYCNQRSWPIKLVQQLGAVFNCTVLPDHKTLAANSHPPLGFTLHFIDVYMDELTKVSRGHLQNDDLLVALLRPFAVYLSETTERTIGTQIVSQIFDRLIEQSKEGHKFREKFEAWKQLGFPRGNIDAVERVDVGESEEEMEEEEDDERVLDPRAGGVNVELPVANFNPETIINLLKEFRHSKTSNSWSRKIVARLIARFNALSKGAYPLGVKKVDKIPKINFKKMAKQSADELLEFRDRIMNEDDDEWIENLKGGKRKSAPKKSTKSDEDDSEETEDEDEDDFEDTSELEESEDDDGDVDDDVEVEPDDEEDLDNDIHVDDDSEEVSSTENVDRNLGNGSVDGEESEEELESDNENEDVEMEEEPLKLKTGKNKKPKKNNQVIQETPQKKNQAAVVENPKYSPLTVTNGISINQEKTPEKQTPKKEETVIVVGKKRKLSETRGTPIIQRGKQFRNLQNSPRTPQTPGSAKKVQFILQRNTVQATSEYDKMLRENPGNPYDSAKKPRFGVLKSTPLSSPVNPFYTP